MKGGSPYMKYGADENENGYDCTIQQVIIVVVCMYLLYNYIIKPQFEYFRDGTAYNEPHVASRGQRHTTPYTGGEYGRYWKKVIDKLSNNGNSV